ncbi:tectonin beta-propeller repeat-containing protein 2 [Plakobranchus ocellatus]|uniref:Tectonin beta-propeller repeat-containing protein 2 n=1 Tax=Plakobranchus ocellatus TaxID=259542 RepID=A0AAV4BDW2_9GAST|nr:tectonin beta-propeller repeat-containing protein 2 [Plakobranchus ocellatus]
MTEIQGYNFRQNQGSVITCVSLHEGIDDMVAMGTASGDVTVFCLPGMISVQKKQIQKFDVQGIHHHYITCLAWSTNGMKLFSGDKKGQVVVAEIDFYQGVSKSCSLLIEPLTEITQIDYQNRVLLVSTRHRSFVVRLDQNSQVAQIGSQERKILGSFGACFVPELCKPSDLKLYASRPGCRLWQADVEGNVKNTHIFKDPLSAGVPEIPLLTAGKLPLQQDDFQFGQLLWLQSNVLVTWTHSALVILDPLNNSSVLPYLQYDDRCRIDLD